MSQLATMPPMPALRLQTPRNASGIAEAKTVKLPTRPHVLIVSDRPLVAERLQMLLRPYKFNIEICDSKHCASLFGASKLHGVLLDWSAQHSPEVIAKVRSSAANRTAIVCAVADNSSDLRSAFNSGCNFILDQPLSAANIQRLLRVMNGLIVKEHRHYFRCRERVSVTLQSAEVHPPLIECVDLSETGIALQMRHNLAQDDKLKLNINLLDGKPPIQLEAQVRRVEPNSAVGLSFTNVPVPVLTRLQNWIEEQITLAEKLFLKQSYATS